MKDRGWSKVVGFEKTTGDEGISVSRNHKELMN